MPVIEIEIMIQAPIERCFDLARDVRVHTETVSHTREKVIGTSAPLLNCGDTVTWEAVHFGIRQRLTAKIIEMNRPFQFTDIQVKGAFHSFTHSHLFREGNGGTMMKDVFEYQSPFGIFGKLVDRLFLEHYMERFLSDRANALKRIAEEMIRNDEEEVWKQV